MYYLIQRFVPASGWRTESQFTDLERAIQSVKIAEKYGERVRIIQSQIPNRKLMEENPFTLGPQSKKVRQVNYKVQYQDANGKWQFLLDRGIDDPSSDIWYFDSAEEAMEEAKYAKFSHYQIIQIMRMDYSTPTYDEDE